MIQSADMFASIVVFAVRMRSPSSRYQLRKHVVCQGIVEPLAAADTSCESGHVAAMLCQVSPEQEQEVCIYRS